MMFKDEYRRMNDRVHADEALIRRTLNAARAKRPARSRMLPIVAALVCLLVVLTLPRLLRPSSPDVTSANVTATPAPTFSPIGHCTSFDGMALRYLSSYSANGSTFILLSLQGDAVTEEMTLNFALMSEKTGQTFWVGTTQLNHDPARRLSTFALEFHESELTQYTPITLTANDWMFPSAAYDPSAFRPLPPDDRLTLTLLQYRHLHSAPLGDTLPLEALPTDAATIQCAVDSAYPESAAPNGQATVLAPSAGRGCAPFADVTVSAGFSGDSLYVQTMCPGGEQILSDGRSTANCWVYLMPTRITENPWLLRGVVEGLPAPAVTIVRNGDVQLRDYRFDVSRSELLEGDESWQLWAVSLKSIDMPDNSVTLAFTLGEDSVTAATEFQPRSDGHAQYEYTILPDGTIRLDKYIGTGTTVQLPLTLHGRTVSDFSCAYQNAAIDHLIIPEGVTEIPHSALLGSSVRTVTLPSTLRVIRSYAFSGCRNLTRIELPEGLEAIVDCAFASSGLTEVNLPSTLTHIGDQAFAMTALRRVVIPSGVTRIGVYAFATNQQLEYVVIPESVVFIDETAFAATPNLTLVVAPGSNAEHFAISHNIPCIYELP